MSNSTPVSTRGRGSVRGGTRGRGRGGSSTNNAGGGQQTQNPATVGGRNFACRKVGTVFVPNEFPNELISQVGKKYDLPEDGGEVTLDGIVMRFSLEDQGMIFAFTYTDTNNSSGEIGVNQVLASAQKSKDKNFLSSQKEMYEKRIKERKLNLRVPEFKSRADIDSWIKKLSTEDRKTISLNKDKFLAKISKESGAPEEAPTVIVPRPITASEAFVPIPKEDGGAGSSSRAVANEGH